MGCGGVAVMLVGESKNQDKSEDVVRAALNHPLLDVDYRGATGSLVHITGGPDLSLKEAEEVAASLTYELSSNANVIWGARIRDDYEGKIRVMAIMTGVQSAQVLGPQYQADIVEKNTESRYKKVPNGSRQVVEPMNRSSDNGGSIIDIIN
jgi:cell division protein FtsZ